MEPYLSNRIFNFLSLFILMLILCQIWQVEAPSSWCLSPTDKSLSSLSTSLLFWHKKRFHNHLELSQNQPLELAFSPRSSGSFYWRMVFKKQIWVLGKNKKVCVFPSFLPSIHPSIHLKNHEFIENSQFQSNSTRSTLFSLFLYL